MIHNENNHSVGEVTSLSTSEVIQWLESIGFAKYQQNFVAADTFGLAKILDIESVDELQELGIPKFPAKTLMKHIVELKANGFVEHCLPQLYNHFQMPNRCVPRIWVSKSSRRGTLGI